MPNDTLRDEIEKLRTQVAALTAEREAREKAQARPEDAPAQADKDLARDARTSASDAGEMHAEKTEATELKQKFQELVETIDGELKEASPVTVLVVFALGVLVGRLLPR